MLVAARQAFYEDDGAWGLARLAATRREVPADRCAGARTWRSVTLTDHPGRPPLQPGARLVRPGAPEGSRSAQCGWRPTGPTPDCAVAAVGTVLEARQGEYELPDALAAANRGPRPHAALASRLDAMVASGVVAWHTQGEEIYCMPSLTPSRRGWQPTCTAARRRSWCGIRTTPRVKVMGACWDRSTLVPGSRWSWQEAIERGEEVRAAARAAG